MSDTRMVVLVGGPLNGRMIPVDKGALSVHVPRMEGKAVHHDEYRGRADIVCYVYDILADGTAHLRGQDA